MKQCKYGDSYCPCQDGCMCHYEGPNPMKPRYPLKDNAKNLVQNPDNDKGPEKGEI